MHFPNVNITVEALFLLYSQEKCGAFFSYNLHKKIRVPHLWRKITWSIWDPSVFKMAAKSEFSKNHKKIRFVDISEISPERYITGHKETIESLKNRVNFPDSCPLNFIKFHTWKGGKVLSCWSRKEVLRYGVSKLGNEITKVRKITLFVKKANHMIFTENEVLSC